MVSGTYTPTLGQKVITNFDLNPTTAARTYAGFGLGVGFVETPRFRQNVVHNILQDTNVLVAALIAPSGPPHSLFEAFLGDRFTLITGEMQIEEFSRVTRYPALRSRIHPAQAGRMLNAIRSLAIYSGVDRQIGDEFPRDRIATPRFAALHRMEHGGV